MVFYLDVRGQDINEFLANNCSYIGILGSKSEDVVNITKEDISLQKINEHQANDEFLVALGSPVDDKGNVYPAFMSINPGYTQGWIAFLNLNSDTASYRTVLYPDSSVILLRKQN